MAQQFVVVEIDTLTGIYNKLELLLAKVDRLHQEKVLPDEFTVKAAAKELGISPNRLYELIYTREIKAIQHRKKGKYTISREEILKYKSKNIKAFED